jgi:transcriptional regulator with XRE-family HTH domain/tetratricopeptide (TPR) repeat protein
MPADDVTSEAIGPWLRRQREASGLTQEELAARSGLSVRALSDLERGRSHRPHPRSIRMVAKALELPESIGDKLVTTLRSGRAPKADAHVVPRQLPAVPAHFVGRAAEIAMLDELLDAKDGRTIVISAIEGTAGVGKTALAVYWAQRITDRFPDGQLYVNLRGFDPTADPVPPAETLRYFLDALRDSPAPIPATLDGRQALYRSLLAGQRVLILLDNARDPAQVRPLLPSSPGCLVLVTSRDDLAGLVAADGARPLTLDVLTDVEAHQLLAGRLGPARLAAEPAAADDLLDLCARLPLALAITAARAATRPRVTLGELAAELRETGNRLNALTTGEDATDARAAFSWSYQHLPGPAAQMFRLLGLHPGPDITATAAASLAGVALAEARQLLHELTRAHLLTEPVAGRYALHDLLGVYAAELAHASETAEARRAAIGRLLDHYLHTAHKAAMLVSPSRPPVPLAPCRPGVTAEPLVDHRQAARWFRADLPVLLAAAALAAAAGFDVHAWQLPWAMADFLDRRGYWQDSVAAQRTAVAAATRLGDTLGQAVASRALGKAHAWLAEYADARARLDDSLRRYREIDDRHGEARVHQSLMWVAELETHYADALHHAEQALALFRAIDHRAGEAEALNAIGWCQLQLGFPDQARASCQRALALNRACGNRRHEALTLDTLGYVEHRLGEFVAATGRFREAVELFQEFEDRFYQAEVLTHLGDTHFAAGDPGPGRLAWQQALDILDELKHPNAAQLRAQLNR